MPGRNQFGNAELRDMICVYAQEMYNSLAAARKYAELYLNCKIFHRIFTQLGETGSIHTKNRGGRPRSISVEQEEEILVRVAENPQLSTRRLQATATIGKSTISR